MGIFGTITFVRSHTYMLIRFTFVVALASAVLMFSSEGMAQQEYNAFATGVQAVPANSSTRSVLVDVHVRPAGANPSNFTLTFLDRELHHLENQVSQPESTSDSA